LMIFMPWGEDIMDRAAFSISPGINIPPKTCDTTVYEIIL